MQEERTRAARLRCDSSICLLDQRRRRRRSTTELNALRCRRASSSSLAHRLFMPFVYTRGIPTIWALVATKRATYGMQRRQINVRDRSTQCRSNSGICVFIIYLLFTDKLIIIYLVLFFLNTNKWCSPHCLSPSSISGRNNFLYTQSRFTCIHIIPRTLS